ASRHHHALRRGRARGGLSRAALRRRLPRLQDACAPLAVAVERERRLMWVCRGRTDPHQRFALATNACASFASALHETFGLTTVTHSFISRPCPGSNGLPSPFATNASTRALGSFTTSVPCVNKANSLPFAFRPFDPNLRGRAEALLASNVSATARSFGSPRNTSISLPMRRSGAAFAVVCFLRAVLVGRPDGAPSSIHFRRAVRPRMAAGSTRT